MFKRLTRYGSIALLSAGLIFGAAGCDWNKSDTQRERDEKTRDQIANETEKLKPEIQEAGRKLGEAAQRAGEEAHAAAEGVKEGWERGGHQALDINTASEKQLTELSGITLRDARRIIANRPYSDKRDLVTKKILPKSSYEKIEDQIVVK